jgi:hypothetical protein
MIYSRWRPDVGGYDYFEDARTLNLNDDLDTPSLPRGTPLGVPSIECGRPIPADAVHAGEGDVVIGVVSPVDPAKLVRRTRSLGAIALGSTWRGYAIGAAVLYGAAFVTYRVLRRRR